MTMEMVSMHELGLPHSVVSPKTIAGPMESICRCYSLPQVACSLPKVKGEGSVAALHIEVVLAIGERLETMQKVGTSRWWLKVELRVRWVLSMWSMCNECSMLFRWIHLEGIQAGRGRPGVLM